MECDTPSKHRFLAIPDSCMLYRPDQNDCSSNSKSTCIPPSCNRHCDCNTPKVDQNLCDHTGTDFRKKSE
eukprot:4331174-Amphidinium_carterae.1